MSWSIPVASGCAVHQVIIGGKAQKASQHVYPARRGGSMGISSGLDDLIQPMIHQDISGGNYRLSITD